MIEERLYKVVSAEEATRGVLLKKGVLKNFTKFTGKHLCQRPLLPGACSFIKKETLAQVFSWEYCGIFKNTFLIEHLQTTASVSASGMHRLLSNKNYSG